MSGQPPVGRPERRNPSNVVAWPPQLEKRSHIHWPRRLFHMCSGLGFLCSGFIYTEKVDWLWFLGSLVGVAFLVEAIRFMFPSFNQYLVKNFSFLMRTGEEAEASGVIYFVLGCFLSALFFPRLIALMSIMYLAIGDPIAALVGVRWGKHRYHLAEPHRGKSLEGSAACGFVCMIFTFALSYWISKTESLVLKDRVLFSILGGTGAMLGELIPFRTDDNMALPLLAGAFLWLMAAVLNLIPGLYI